MRHQITDTPRFSAFLRLRWIFALSLLLFAFASCEHDNLELTKPNENVRPLGDFIRNNYDFTLFYAALERTGLIDTLNGPGPFTVLVPNDKCFHELGIQRPSDFDHMDLDSLREILRYHILPQRLLRTDVPANGVDVRYQTLAGVELYATVASYHPGNEAYPDNQLYFGGAYAYRTDVSLANGILHVINKVMKRYPGATVQDWLAARPEYSIFTSGLKKFGLWDELATEGPFTVFAPKNEYFEAQGMTEESINDLDISQYIGARLFGTYIMYQRHYFISDKPVFAIINNEVNFGLQLRNDSYYLALGVTPLNYPVNDLSYSLYLQTAPSYPYQQIGTAQGAPAAQTDNICENGLVHPLQGVLITPDKALKPIENE